MRHVSRGVAFVATTAALALAASASEFEGVGGGRQPGRFDEKYAEAAGGFESAASSNPPESLAVQVAEIQGMDEAELKLELRAMYSTSKDVQEKMIYPVGSLEAMQDVLNSLGSVDEEQRDLIQFMNRFAYLLGKSLRRYTEFFSVKVLLGNPELSSSDYAKSAKKLPVLASSWMRSSELLVAYLQTATTDLKDKWEQSATTEKRLREVLRFLEKLLDVYETQQKLFRMGYTLAKLRYEAHPDRQADLTVLMEDPRYKQAVAEFETALEEIQEKTHQTRKAAASCVEDGILPSEYLALLPFPPDKQREADDLPHDEIEILPRRSRPLRLFAELLSAATHKMRALMLEFKSSKKQTDGSAGMSAFEESSEDWKAKRQRVWRSGQGTPPLLLYLLSPLLPLFLSFFLFASVCSSLLFCLAAPYEADPYAPRRAEVPFDAYNVRGFAGEQQYYYAPVFFPPQQPVLDPRFVAPPPPPPPPPPYAYDRLAFVVPREGAARLLAPGAPEPFVTRPYDYTRDFLTSLQTIKELKDPAVRSCMLALKELEPSRPGSLFGDHELKVVVLWKRADEKWGLGVTTVEMPQGHNPSVRSFVRLFLLNASTAASSKCIRSWFRMRLKLEAKPQKTPEFIHTFKQEDLMTPLRNYREIRIVLEDPPTGIGGKRCFTRTLDKRFADFLPANVFEELPPVTVKLLVLKPVSVERHISDESGPFEDGPVVYSFEAPYKTSFIREIQVPMGANPTLYRVAKMYLQRAMSIMRTCSISTNSLVPSFAAIAKDEAGKVQVLPLNNLDTPVRALGWAAAEGEAESGREFDVHLVLYLRHILKSEAANPCFEANFPRSVPEEIAEKMHMLPVWVTTQCSGVLLRKCKRKLFEVHFKDTKTTVRDALAFLRAHMQLSSRRREDSSCFVGRARLKRRMARSLLPGSPWKEIPLRTLLMDISRLKSGVLLAPATTLLSLASVAAHTVCPSYVSLLQQKQKQPFVVLRSAHGTAKHPVSAFGPNSVHIFE
ncbi:hypothetical protein Efla_005628 [Eimeria flavescens]